MLLSQKEFHHQPTEHEFRREENKFFVPPTWVKSISDEISVISQKFGLQRESHLYPITRSFYYSFGNIGGVPLGSSIRYREYVSQPGGGTITRKSNWFNRIKMVGQYCKWENN